MAEYYAAFRSVSNDIPGSFSDLSSALADSPKNGISGGRQWQTGLLGHISEYCLRTPVMEAANVDGQSGINVADLTYLVDYLFFEGDEPVCGPIE